MILTAAPQPPSPGQTTAVALFLAACLLAFTIESIGIAVIVVREWRASRRTPATTDTDAQQPAVVA